MRASGRRRGNFQALPSRGASSYVRKPVDFVQFVDAVQQLGLFWLVVNQPPPEPDSAR